VITELVLNHTSDQHPWFQRARRSPPGSPERDFYVWSDTPERYRDARVIFQDFEGSNWTYDQRAKAYYWHRFYAHQPDLNFDNPAVWEALYPIVDFWFEMGVDGMRLDAIPYLYEREGTNCENLPETHRYLKALRKHVDERFPGRMFLAEANQWPEDAVAYFGNGDECHMAFHFPLMPRLFMAIHTQDRFPIVDILAQTPAIPENCQWALFLRNHDELTLEMVTDEERDSLYRAYAHDRQARINLGIRRRLAPLLSNNRRRIELMNGLLFSLPGTPVLYYGDEIGMGDNIYLGDRNGVRTPMQWSSDRNAGFSRANPQKLYLPIIIDPEFHYESVNVEAQQANPHSLLWWTKRLIAMRRQHRAFSRGTLEFLDPNNRKILAFIRKYEDDALLVVANLSRFVQFVELDLSEFRGQTPLELFGGTPFPKIGELPYLLTLGPHSFYWFSLSQLREAEQESAKPKRRTVSLAVRERWEELLEGPDQPRLEAALKAFLQRSSDKRVPRAVRLQNLLRVPSEGRFYALALLDLEFNEGDPETRLLPLAFSGSIAEEGEGNHRIIAVLTGGAAGALYDASDDVAFNQALVEFIAGRRRVAGSHGGELIGWRSANFADARGDEQTPLTVTAVGSTHDNQWHLLSQRLALKLYRRVDIGLHPEVEIGNLLGSPSQFGSAAPLVGGLEFSRRRAEPLTLAALFQYVPHETDGWQYALDALSDFFDRVATLPPPQHQAEGAPTVNSEEVCGPFLVMMGRLGQRLGELHVALATRSDTPAFAPEGFTPQYQRSLYQSLRNAARDALHELVERRQAIPAEAQPLVDEAISKEHELLEIFRNFISQRFHAQRIRCHSDCHLAHTLFTGTDFVFIDFEGPPEHSIDERRLKRSSFRDVAAMLCSLQSAAISTLLGLSSRRGRPQGSIREEDRERLSLWAQVWYRWSSSALLQSYYAATAEMTFIPTNESERDTLLNAFLLNRWLEELERDLKYRTPWAIVPLRGLLRAIAAIRPAAEVSGLPS
jgi:maltose alpha-D-glucosyltransferase/alpha-amylase